MKKINQTTVQSEAFLEEYLAQRYPGDEVRLEIQRENKTLYKTLVLTNREGTTDIIRRVTFYSKDLGATFENLSKVERDALNIRGGVRVVDYERRGFFRANLIYQRASSLRLSMVRPWEKQRNFQSYSRKFGDV